MAKFSLKCAADGTHELHGPQGRIGTMDEGELRDYAKTHLAMRDCEGKADFQTATRLSLVIGTTRSGQRLGRLIREIQLSENIGPDAALNRAVLTEEGKRLFEAKRLEELQESAVEKRFTQDLRD